MAKKNYKILKNDTFGRYMVASKNIKAGELILKEKPTLVGAQLDGPLICVSCCQNVAHTGYIFCKNCNKAVICSPKCTGNLHSIEECLTLKEANVNGEELAQYDQITFPLRCILWRNYNPAVWKSAITELESHLERRRDSHIWRKHKVTVEQILSECNVLSEEDLKNELVQKVCGILDVNTFELRPPKRLSDGSINPMECLRGLYLEAALMAHDCIGNTHLSVDDDFVLIVHASVDIPENTAIFFNYSNVLQGTIERRQHLREGKYFECSCLRCKDVTELGTNLSSLKCHRCRKGLIRLIDPYNIKSDWECSECKRKFYRGLINTTVEEGRRRIQDIDPTNVNDLENLFNKLSSTFHPNHYLMLELQQNIVGLYSRLPPTKKNLKRKVTLCRELLEVFSKIEPGLSRIKAFTLYQLQSSLIDLSHKQYREKEISSDELILHLLSAENTLKEAIKHLLYEPPKSPEGKLAQTALVELKMLRSSITSMQNDVLNCDYAPKLTSKSNERNTHLEKKGDMTVPASKDCKDIKTNELQTSNKKTNKRKQNKKKNHNIE